MSQQCIINQPVTVPFLSASLTTGLTSFTGTHVLMDGVTDAITFTTSEIGNGLYTLTITPVATGVLSIFIEGQLIVLEVENRSVSSFLQDLSDEALGSWEWNKVTGGLTLLRQDASTLATFTVVDNSSVASRERIS